MSSNHLISTLVLATFFRVYLLSAHFIFGAPRCTEPFSSGKSSGWDLIAGAVSCPYENQYPPISNFVQFFMITKGDRNYKQFTRWQLGEKISKNKTTILFIHGFLDHVDISSKEWMIITGKKLCIEKDATVILVNWGKLSSCNYFYLSTSVVRDLGYYLAGCIATWNLDPSKIELIGHSLGAHICGFIGSNWVGPQQIANITALDPAGPLFEEPFLTDHLNRLNPSCAQFVQVIHTNGNFFGTYEPMGHSDFYANNKSVNQPGCGLNFLCSHNRALELYYASCFPEYNFIGVDCATGDRSINSTFGVFNDRKDGCFTIETSACFGYLLQVPQ